MTENNNTLNVIESMVQELDDNALEKITSFVVNKACERGVAVDLGLFILEDIADNLDISEEEAKKFAQDYAQSERDYSDAFDTMRVYYESYIN